MTDIQAYKTKELYAYFTSSTGVSTDTRSIEKGNLFFALKGGNFNGNAYAKQALEKGASFAIVDEAAYAGGENHILVPDALKALQLLATHHRQQFDIPFLAITGSNGKTTTKELCQAVLSQEKRAYATPGNFNNHIGVPLTLLRMPPDTEIAIIEMGDNRIGDVAELCEIALPTHGLITNIGKDHLEGFGSFEGNIRAKSELFQFLRENQGKVFVNANDPLLVPMGKRFRDAIWYGNRKQEEWLELQAQNPFISYVDENSKSIDTQLFGGYNFENIQTAYAVGRHFGLSRQSIHRGIAEYTPKNNRSQIVRQNGKLIILDAYNSNPSSLEAALRSFHALETDKPKLAILGDMLELGSISEEEHLNAARLCQELGIESYLCGALFADAGRKIGNFSGKVFDSKEALSSQLKMLKGEVAILIKGSRGMKLETLLASL